MLDVSMQDTVVSAFCTCSVGVNLYKQGIFAQTATQEKGSDVMSCFFHGFQNMKCTKLRAEKKK